MIIAAPVANTCGRFLPANILQFSLFGSHCVNIWQIYDVDPDYLVTELVEGPNKGACGSGP